MIQPAAILAHDFGAPVQDYGARDAILYALGLGLGREPEEAAELRFLDERQLTVLPTFAATLCTPGLWLQAPRFGVDLTRLVHLAQWAEFHERLPPTARVRGSARVTGLHDRGNGRGAVLEIEREIVDAGDGHIYARLRQTLLLRGDGGFGGEPPRREERWVPPGEPDFVAHQVTSPRAALIYRLSGDWNPLHLDPHVAQAAGFPRPILHGLASWGMAALAVSRALEKDPADLKLLACRFSGIVLPGDTLELRIWRQEDGGARFDASVADRKVLDDGRIAWRSA